MANKPNGRTEQMDIFSHSMSVIDATALQHNAFAMMQTNRMQLALLDQLPVVSSAVVKDMADLNRHCSTFVHTLNAGEMDADGTVWFDDDKYHEISNEIKTIMDIKTRLAASGMSLEDN